MNSTHLQRFRPLFLLAAIAGFLLVNVPFLYFVIFRREVYHEAMANGVALVFIGEAFLLMLLFAFLVSRLGLQRPGWILFIVLSLLGSMAFSIPLFLYLHLGRQDACKQTPAAPPG